MIVCWKLCGKQRACAQKRRMRSRSAQVGWPRRLFFCSACFALQPVRRTRLKKRSSSAKHSFDCDLVIGTAMRTCRSRARFSLLDVPMRLLSRFLRLRDHLWLLLAAHCLAKRNARRRCAMRRFVAGLQIGHAAPHAPLRAFEVLLFAPQSLNGSSCTTHS